MHKQVLLYIIYTFLYFETGLKLKLILIRDSLFGTERLCELQVEYFATESFLKNTWLELDIDVFIDTQGQLQ